MVNRRLMGRPFRYFTAINHNSRATMKRLPHHIVLQRDSLCGHRPHDRLCHSNRKQFPIPAGSHFRGYLRGITRTRRCAWQWVGFSGRLGAAL